MSYSNENIRNPATAGISIIPSDETEHKFVRAIYVGGSGDVAVQTIGMASPYSHERSEFVLKNVASGSIIPIRVTKVLATGTTATDIVGLV